MKLSFQQWYAALRELAESRDLLHLISDEPEDHRDSYEDELSPDEELDEQIYAAST